MKKKAEAEAAPSSAAAASSARASPAQYNDPDVKALLLMLVQSYWRATRKPLLPNVELAQLGEALYGAPFVLLAHNRFQEGVTDPEFIYANHAALQLWEATWEQLIGMPSRKSASDDPAVQEQRQQLLDGAASSGLITDYSGWRVSLTGKRFRISGVTLFNIEDADGDKLGQAAVFDSYELEDGTVIKVEGLKMDQAPAGSDGGGTGGAGEVVPVTPEDVAAAEEGVKQWADYIRALKEEYGKQNSDPEVASAVQELKARKEALAAWQAALAAQQAADAAAAAAAREEEEQSKDF